MDGWMDGGAGLRIAYSNQKLSFFNNIVIVSFENGNVAIDMGYNGHYY